VTARQNESPIPNPESLIPSPIHLIVFDLDGTLVDSRRDITDAANALLESCGAPALSEDRIGAMVGDGAATLVARAFEASGIDRPDDALERYLSLYGERLLAHTKPYPGMVETLEVLSGRARLAVLTNKPIRATLEILDGLELARFFDRRAVLGGDGPFARKPDPTALRHLQRQAGVEPGASVLVGDSAIDCRTARAADTPLCIARYGFGFATLAAEVLSARDRIVDSPRELLDL
jgi:phosphoglycolate phosphatase